MASLYPRALVLYWDFKDLTKSAYRPFFSFLSVMIKAKTQRYIPECSPATARQSYAGVCVGVWFWTKRRVLCNGLKNKSQYSFGWNLKVNNARYLLCASFSSDHPVQVIVPFSLWASFIIIKFSVVYSHQNILTPLFLTLSCCLFKFLL